MEPAAIRKARLNDVTAIQKLVAEFAAKEAMLPLSIGDLYERLRDFLVVEAEGQVVGCGAIHVTWENLVELRSLAVSSTQQGRKVGARLMEALLQEARDLGAVDVFTLTYIPDFFKRFGFIEVDRQSLPHKVWLDCTKCPKFPDCGEVAMTLRLIPGD